MLDDTWAKSSFSTGGDANCVECRTAARRVLVRDSQHPDRGQLSVSHREWRAFLRVVRHDERI
ncbi:DUF397 domain-containing protein [Spiractinospora alimapuensis]|uniref:DUF397 domain-containing protein n=1 Tax=Spiractinospora alimapuensis TaxID=2820884 RepID=UPI001F46BAAE|nr:DUF397 domain-containing protein [Spiractinospora alimapuensis]QVQ52214.1 DUF397 domain-containing protein [Spiractinospora alimapuensis]